MSLDERPRRLFTQGECNWFVSSLLTALSESACDGAQIAHSAKLWCLMHERCGGQMPTDNEGYVRLAAEIAHELAPVPDGTSGEVRTDMTDRECIAVLSSVLLSFAALSTVTTVRNALRWAVEKDSLWEAVDEALRRLQRGQAKVDLVMAKGGSA